MTARRSWLWLHVATLVALAVGGNATGSDSAVASQQREPAVTRASMPLPLVVAQVPERALPTEALADGTLRRDFGDGGRLVFVAPSGRVRLLTAGFASAADPEVSFDGGKLLFAGRKSKTDPWCAWEMNLDGTGARRITCGAAGVRHPVYQSTIYTLTPTGVEPWVQIAFTGINPGEHNEAGVGPNTSLWSSKTDGTTLRRLTFNLSNDMDPVILPDGRMVYSGWMRHAAGPGDQGRVALLGVNEDGTDYQAYAGPQGLRVQHMPTPTARGLVVFVEADRVSGDGAGSLAAVDQIRPLHSYRSLSGAADGFFRAPAPLPDGRVLVAWRRDTTARYAIVRVDATSGKREPAFDAPGWHSVEAVAVAARTAPDARSSVVLEDDPDGTLYSIDVNIHDLGERLPRGVARRVRFVEGVAATADRAVTRRILGEVALAADGSYQAKVPANTPLQLQLLDADGLAIRTSAWLWVRGHAAQGCVGCHEDPERTPPNRLMAALATPAPMLNVPTTDRRTVTAADIQATVAARCVRCHGRGGSLPSLDGGVDALLPYTATGVARRSSIVWHVLGRSTARPWDPEHGRTGPRLPGTDATSGEIKTLIEWLDLGAQR